MAIAMRPDVVPRHSYFLNQTRIPLRNPTHDKERRPYSRTVEEVEQRQRRGLDPRRETIPVLLAQHSTDAAYVEPLLEVDCEDVVGLTAGGHRGWNGVR